MQNIIDIADAGREIWELDNDPFDDFDDPFDDEYELPPVVSREDIVRDMESARADAQKREQGFRQGCSAARASQTVAAQKSDAASTPASTPNAENYAICLEEEWRSDAAPDCTPQPILSDPNSIYAPKSKSKAQKSDAASTPVQADAQKAKRAEERAARLSAFDAAFAMPRAVVLDLIAAAQRFAPDAVRFEKIRAELFYQTQRAKAGRDPTFDYAAEAGKYQAARLRSLQNMTKAV